MTNKGMSPAEKAAFKEQCTILEKLDFVNPTLFSLNSILNAPPINGLKSPVNYPLPTVLSTNKNEPPTDSPKGIQSTAQDYYQRLMSASSSCGAYPTFVSGVGSIAFPVTDCPRKRLKSTTAA